MNYHQFNNSHASLNATNIAYMLFTTDSITSIELPDSLWSQLTGHCQRKLHAEYLADEAQEIKAFGLVAGKVANKVLRLTAIAPLKKNSRSLCCQKPYMDAMMAKHAIPSETPLDQRGWIADPGELQENLKEFKKDNSQLVGSYHMHRVAWDHDQKRETPTELDEILGEESRMFMFIIAMVNPDKPTIRAFFEGNKNLEVPITLVQDSLI